MLTIIQNFPGELFGLQAVTADRHAALAASHDYRYQASQAEPPPGKTAPWGKISLLADWCVSAGVGDEAVFIGAECLIIRDTPLTGLTNGRDIALVRYESGKYSWYGTDVIAVRKRSDRLGEFFNNVLVNGPMFDREKLPVAADGECGRVNDLLPSASLNVATLGNEYCGTILAPQTNPIIHSWRGAGVKLAEKAMRRILEGASK